MARVARFGSNILCFGQDQIYCKFCIVRISDKVKNNNFVVNIRKNIDDSLIPKYWCMCYLWLTQFGVKIGDTQVVSQSISILRCAFSPAPSRAICFSEGGELHINGQLRDKGLGVVCLSRHYEQKSRLLNTHRGDHTRPSGAWKNTPNCFISLFFKRFSRHKYQDCC